MDKQKFIEDIAICVQKYAPMFGIEVCSPIIAQAVLESGYGTSAKAKYHNYFGLKYRNNRVTCNNGYFKDGGSEQNSDGSYSLLPSETSWYAFDNLELGVLGYFQFIDIANYSILKGVIDPYEYLTIIKECGYATSLKYVDNVYKVIENWNLTQYDEKEEVKMSRPKVCIDAGHNGKRNMSPNNSKYYESEVMWKLHLMQKEYLEQLGIEVITTRPDLNSNPDLYTRGATAKGCDLFISNHTNAVGSAMNESVDYVAVFHLVEDFNVNSDDISVEVAKLLAPVIHNVMGVKQNYKVLDRRASTDRNKDGVLNDNYYGVLHGARQVNVAGLILEHSFHTNTKVVNWLLVDSNLRALAKAEAECIAKYLLGADLTQETPKNDIPSNTIYRVQAGAFSNKQNAINQYNAIKSKGFDCILIKVDNLYKVQIGAFAIKENADKMYKSVNKAGFSAFITTQGGTRVSVEEVAPTKEIVIGSTVKVRNGAKTYGGISLASFVYTRNHKVSNIKGDRVVITFNGSVVCAVKKQDLILV